MILRLLVPVYALTLLLSAVLLFSVQPMFTKMILPLLGGAPQVWNTAMLFFQACLLGGYAYAHITSKYLSVRWQGALHVALLALFIIVLPFAIPPGWEPPAGQDPTLWQLSLMALTVGGPFFVLSGSAPMLQHWFSQSAHKDSANPYFLYGASNLGSMTALLTYPVLTEPLLNLTQQTYFWMAGYILLIILMLCSMSFLRKNKLVQVSANDMPSERISLALRLKWVILAAIPSSLMLGVTTYLTTDIASVPLLWVIPLALYLATFIIVFANKPIIKVDYILAILAGILIVSFLYFYVFHLLHNPLSIIFLHMSLFFFMALYCHHELALIKPRTKHLTEFYLLMSLGGVIGGFFNAIIAPIFFTIPVEYHMMLAAAALMALSEAEFKTIKRIFDSLSDGLKIIIAVSFGLTFCLAFTIFLAAPAQENKYGTILRDRNFFGIIRVVKSTDFTTLFHGTTVHGIQANMNEFKLVPLSYYSEQSPIADIFSLNTTAPENIGAVGLGVGSISCYTQEGRQFDFYEIDQDIVDVAQNKKYFSYLSDCESPYQIILGDGRLKMAQKPDHMYDTIILDAFSSDNIPVHLITIEAIKIYLAKLKPDGVLVFHISNNYLDLEPVLANAGLELGIPALATINEGGKLPDSGYEFYPSHYVAFTRNVQFLETLREKGWTDAVSHKDLRIWSDQYSNIFSVFGGKTFNERVKARRQAREEEEEQSQP